MSPEERARAEMEAHFFFEEAGLRSCFEALRLRIEERWPDAWLKVQKTQISFCGDRPFCLVWLPAFRRIGGCSGNHIYVSFMQPDRKEHSRIVQAVEPYPGRWMHHVAVYGPDEIDEELLNWISASHAFRCGMH